MREKFIDSALLAGMVIICVVILYTLFSPPTRGFGRNTTSPQDEVRVDVAPLTEDDAPSIDSNESEADVPEIASSEAANSEASDIVLIAPAEDVSEAQPEQETDTQEASEASEGDAPASDVEILLPDAAQEEANSLLDEADDRDSVTVATEEDELVEAVQAEAEPDLEPLVPVPAGSFSLERIGFSFVTGGSGACGIVLEAWQHVAVSRDILERYPCGSELTIRLDDSVDGREQVTAIVADTMNPVNARTVNIYVGTDEPALEYGINTGTLSP